MVPLPVSRDVDIRPEIQDGGRRNEMYIFYGCMADDERQFLHSSGEFKCPWTQGKQNDNIWNTPTPDS